MLTISDPVTVANRLRPVLLQLNRQLRRELAPLGITGGQAALLHVIRTHPGIGVRELAKREGVSAAAMSTALTRLRRHRNYRLFFSGQVVSVSGTWMQNIATAWLVLDLSHSALIVGLLALCQFLPFTLFGLFAGVVVDRLDARRTVIWTQIVSMG